MADRSPLVLLPGLLCDAELWRQQADDLSAVADPWIADLTQDDGVEAMAARVLAGAPPRFALAALSMGGYVAFEIMRQAPERVLRLALFDTSASPDAPERQAQRRAGIDSLRHGRFVGVTARLLPQLIHRRHVEGEVGRRVREMAERVGADAYLRQQKAILARPDFRPLLATIAVPTLVVVGGADMLTPPDEAWTIHRGIPGSSLHVIGDCSHLPALEAPDTTSALLGWWLGGLP